MEIIRKFCNVPQFQGVPEKEMNAVDDYRMSALMYAAKFQPPKIVMLLVKNGADSNKLDENYKPALFHALKHNNSIKVSRYFIDLKENVIVPYKESEFTALEFACAYNSFELIDYLITKGAGPDKVGFSHPIILGMSIDLASFAEYKKTSGIARIRNFRFRRNSKGINPLTSSMGDFWYHFWSVTIIQNLINHIENINALTISPCGTFNSTLLTYTVIVDNLFIVQSLVEKNADVNLTDNRRTTALMLVFSLDIFKFLLWRRAYMHAIDEKGNTVVHRIISNYRCSESDA